MPDPETSSALRRFTVTPPVPFRLETVVRSHGWVELAPRRWDGGVLGRGEGARAGAPRRGGGGDRDPADGSGAGGGRVAGEGAPSPPPPPCAAHTGEGVKFAR